MNQEPRRRSPRCPSIDLGDALKRTESIYQKGRTHAMMADAAAQSLGYKNSGSGIAKSILAALCYFGLIERKGGKFSVSSDFEKYMHAPDKEKGLHYLETFLKKPTIFESLIEKYGMELLSLPSDAIIKYDLIEQGFRPEAAEEAVGAFKRSLEFIERQQDSDLEIQKESENDTNINNEDETIKRNTENKEIRNNIELSEFKKITIFLPEGREAVLHVPRPFYIKDKLTINRQIGALLADDEDLNDAGGPKG
ncbi:MAG: hypothetical protein JKP92_05615 [Alphaproteobacteria bacterium]|nr:hypothetical protein [Alphaproteobacteria bacterium]